MIEKEIVVLKKKGIEYYFRIEKNDLTLDNENLISFKAHLLYPEIDVKTAEGNNYFILQADHINKSLKFDYQDFLISEELQCMGLGSYLFNKLIETAINEYSGYTRQQIKLSSEDSKTDDERELRNGFYRSFGFNIASSFEYGMISIPKDLNVKKVKDCTTLNSDELIKILLKEKDDCNEIVNNLEEQNTEENKTNEMLSDKERDFCDYIICHKFTLFVILFIFLIALIN